MVRLEDAVLVVAHPDDEVLWSNSILSACKAIVVCFGPSATSKADYDEGRKKLIEAYPLEKARFLKIRQSDVFRSADWDGQFHLSTGLHLRRPSASYAANEETLLRLLRPILEGERVIFTHNPWGEYGHEEHAQISRVILRLQEELGFNVFVNGYVSNRSSKVMLKSSGVISGAPIVRRRDVAISNQLMKLYIDYKCWTWPEDWEWPEWEIFYPVAVRAVKSAPEIPTTATPPLTYINYDFRQFRQTRLGDKVARASQFLPAPVKSTLKRALRRD
jgi:LmbE family N-acetylglucosaminyl deacetylase